MIITEIGLHNFRCFGHFQCTFDAPITLIEGRNGTGKTAILEALNYACYLRSFRTHAPRELVRWEEQGYGIQLSGNELDLGLGGNWELKIGVSGNRRAVKLNNQPITSFRDLLNTYRCVTVLGSDEQLITGFPEERRLFVDQALILESSHNYSQLLRETRTIVRQRNALLNQPGNHQTELRVWTDQLVEVSQQIQVARCAYLDQVAEQTKTLGMHFAHLITPPAITLEYRPTKNSPDVESRELYYKRTLFGPHLDDIAILYNGRPARHFASRGQQKLTAFLLKLAQLVLIKKPTLFLIDDFATDLDTGVLTQILTLLTEHTQQTIITAPTGNPVRALLDAQSHQVVFL